MKNITISILFAAMLFMVACAGHKPMPVPENSDGFVDIKQAIPSVRLDIRYDTDRNFVGERVDGYNAPKCLLTKEAAAALVNVQENLERKRMSLMIFNFYRLQRAVNHFVRWAQDLGDQKMKSEYYPSVDKKNLFRAVTSQQNQGTAGAARLI